MLFLDQHCEIASMMQPFADEVYYVFDRVPTVPGATYIVGREQMRLNADRISDMTDQCRIVFSNPAEGSETMIWHLRRYGIEDLVLSGKIQLIGGGRMPEKYNQLLFEHFLTQPFRFAENIAACNRTPEIFAKQTKPFKFLCLNGRHRLHRKELLAGLGQRGLLEQALWTNLDSATGPVQLLPQQYEVERYNNTVGESGFVKGELFGGEWGEIYIRPEPYIDTYFSVVTETVFEYPASFFTEKIAKPIAIGHPFIAVANAGFYRDLRDLGFKTFNGIIDESFDSYDSNYNRLQRIITVVDDLCQQDLGAFIRAAEPICKYNQQHLQEFSTAHMAELPQRILDFIK